jgi:gliding motility-associated-like protein/predicted ribosomally synthesized peptide with SipW-like signal peptide
LAALPTTSINGYTGTWSPALNNTATTVYTFTPTAGQCATTTTLTITINPLPVLTITNPAAACSPLMVDITAAAVTAGSTGGGTLSYWTNPAATNPLTTPTSVSNSATYYIQSITGAGCKDIQPVTVLVNTTPVLTITNPAAVCSPLTVDITAALVTAGSTGGGALSYWNDAAATSPLATPTAVSTSGTYYIQTTTAASCKDIKPVIITINPLPVLTITNPAAVCSPLTVDITAVGVTAGSTGGGTLSYWTNPAATNPLTTPTSVSNSATYYIQSITGAGCKDIQPVTVLVNTTPVLTITNPAAVCSPLTVDITAALVTAGSIGGGTLSYWNDVAATSPLATPTTVSTTGTYYIQTTTAAGCKDIKPVIVTINTLPVLVITNPAGVCDPNTVDITAVAVTAGSTGGGTLSYWTNAGATTALATPTAVAVSGTYYIQATAAGGCMDIQPVTVTINPLPVLAITNPPAVCSPSTVDITAATVTAGSIGGGTLSYWINAGATSALTTSTAITTSGIYYIQTTTAAGCKDIKPVIVTINPLPVLTITNPAGVCTPNTVDITAASVTAGSTGGGTLSYWTDAAATLPLATPTAVTPSGTYYIQTTTAAGCKDIQPVVVTINPLPVPLFVADKISGCPPVCVKFTDGSTVAGGTITNWNWNFGGVGTSNSQNPSFCFTTTGQYNVTLSVTTNSGCNSLSTPTVITVFQNPTAEFNPTPNPASVLASNVTLNNQSSSDVTYWNWQFGDGDSLSPTTPSPTHTYPNDVAANYIATLIVHNANGCYDTVSHEIIIGPEFTFFIPNAFSPNGDGVNDTYYGQGIGISKYELFIFDRWGNLIFYSDELSKAWDGKANHGNDIAQQDVYVWKVKLLDVFGKRHNYIGTVTIVL